MQTVEEVLAAVAKAREVALAKFERDWGTRDVGRVVKALAKTIPGSASPTDAAIRARRLLP